jgi:hypothetical protein
MPFVVGHQMAEVFFLQQRQIVSRRIEQALNGSIGQQLASVFPAAETNSLPNAGADIGGKVFASAETNSKPQGRKGTT